MTIPEQAVGVLRPGSHLDRLARAVQTAGSARNATGGAAGGADVLVRRSPVPGGQIRHSAVLALISDTDRPDIVLTRRNPHLHHHAGQVSLPGGRAEPQDADLVATALREAHEEVGVPASAVRVIGALPATLVAVSSSDVTTVVASWDGSAPLGIVDPGEVAGIRRVPMTELADPQNRVRARHPSGFRGPAFVLPDLFVWGFTAQLLDEILERGGWARAWDPRRLVDIPADYLGRGLNS